MTKHDQTIKAMTELCRSLAEAQHPEAWERLAHAAQFANRFTDKEWFTYDPLRQRHEMQSLINRLRSPSRTLASHPTIQTDSERVVQLLMAQAADLRQQAAAAVRR